VTRTTDQPSSTTVRLEVVPWRVKIGVAQVWGLLLLGGVTFGIVVSPTTVHAATFTAAGLGRSHARTVQAFMTLYGYVDNSPPGRAIAHPCTHGVAGGTGTFADPVTFATDVHEVGWCHRLYVPYMKRYFIHEDECAECDHDWVKLHKYRFDMWAGGDSRSTRNPERSALLGCEDTWTRAASINDSNNPNVTINPPPNLPVSTRAIFAAPHTCRNGH
jgi:hypothetical protein